MLQERLASIMNFLEEVEVPWIRKRHVKRKLFDLRCSAPYTIWDMEQTGQYIGKAESVCFRSLQKQICPRAILGKSSLCQRIQYFESCVTGNLSTEPASCWDCCHPAQQDILAATWQTKGLFAAVSCMQFLRSWSLRHWPSRKAAAAAAASKFFKFQGATSVTSWIHLMGGHLAFHLGWPRRQWHVRDC